MKEKIINFLKSKSTVFFGIKVNYKIFIAIGFLYIFHLIEPIKLIEIFIFFNILGIYFYMETYRKIFKFRNSDPLLPFISYWIFFITLMTFAILLLNKIPSKIFFLLPILYSFFWVKKYIHPNPNRIEIFQFIGVIIFYFLLIKLNYSYYLTLLLLINLILLTSTNILTKRASSILEILGFLFLFLSLIIFFEIDSRPFFENYEAIGLVALNLIGFAIVFFKTESSLEKIKTSLLIILMALQFIFDGIIVYLFYYITILALLFIIILQEKLRIYIFRKIFINLSILALAIIFLILPILILSRGEWSILPNKGEFFLTMTCLINLATLPLIAIFSKKILKKRKLNNGDPSASNFLQK
jgi:hypothetical protein